MEYKRFKNKIVVRMDKGDEILTKLKEIALKENIKLANINALGATDNFTVGVYNLAEKKYYANHFEGYYEIVSLTGSINTMNDEYYAHIHMSCGDEQGHVVGGHLNECFISATLEMFIEVIDGYVDRVKDEEVGLNIFKF